MYFTLPIYNSWDALISSTHLGFIASLLPHCTTKYVFYNVTHDVDAGAATAYFINYFSDIVLNCTTKRDLIIWRALIEGSHFMKEKERMYDMDCNKKQYDRYKFVIKNDVLLRSGMLAEILYVLRYTRPFFKESTGRLYFNKNAKECDEYYALYKEAVNISDVAYSKALKETCKLITCRHDMFESLSEHAVKLACDVAKNKKPFIYIYLPAYTQNAEKNPLPTVVSLLLYHLSKVFDGVKWMCVWRGDYDDEWVKYEQLLGLNNTTHTASYHNCRYTDTVNITRNYKEEGQFYGV